MPTLTQEDGTNVAGANTYATLAQIAAYAAQRGIALPEDDDAKIAQAIAAMDYLAAYEYRLQGKRTFGALQAQAWPRAGVRVFNALLPSAAIPADVINAQCYLACIAGDIDLYGNGATGAIVKETLGPIETDYSSTPGSVGVPIVPVVFSLMRPYIKETSGMLRSVRL